MFVSSYELEVVPEGEERENGSEAIDNMVKDFSESTELISPVL